MAVIAAAKSARVSGELRKDQGKDFFFEKKKQKTFAYCVQR
jgi:hypothetical protein